MDVWPSVKLLNGPFIFTIATLISKFLADLQLPIPTASKWCLETTWNKPPSAPLSNLPPCGKTLPYSPFHPRKLTWPQRGRVIANSGSLQGNCTQTSSPSSRNSRVKFPEGGVETFAKSFGSLPLIQRVEQRCTRPVSVVLIATLFFFCGEDI